MPSKRSRGASLPAEAAAHEGLRACIPNDSCVLLSVMHKPQLLWTPPTIPLVSFPRRLSSAHAVAHRPRTFGRTSIEIARRATPGTFPSATSITRSISVCPSITYRIDDRSLQFSRMARLEPYRFEEFGQKSPRHRSGSLTSRDQGLSAFIFLSAQRRCIDTVIAHLWLPHPVGFIS